MKDDQALERSFQVWPWEVEWRWDKAVIIIQESGRSDFHLDSGSGNMEQMTWRYSHNLYIKVPKQEGLAACAIWEYNFQLGIVGK